MDSCGQIREGSRQAVRRNEDNVVLAERGGQQRERSSKMQNSKILKGERKKESNRRACIIWLEGWENSQESQIASVLQIQQQIATAEGQDHDFNAEVKGTDSRGTIISLDSP